MVKATKSMSKRAIMVKIDPRLNVTRSFPKFLRLSRMLSLDGALGSVISTSISLTELLRYFIILVVLKLYETLAVLIYISEVKAEQKRPQSEQYFQP